MTKRERERARRAAAVIAVASAPHPMDAEDRWRGLRRWRSDNAEAAEGVEGDARSCAGLARDRFAKFWRD
jgi:hypothetical protein